MKAYLGISYYHKMTIQYSFISLIVEIISRDDGNSENYSNLEKH